MERNSFQCPRCRQTENRRKQLENSRAPHPACSKAFPVAPKALFQKAEPTTSQQQKGKHCAMDKSLPRFFLGPNSAHLCSQWLHDHMSDGQFLSTLILKAGARLPETVSQCLLRLLNSTLQAFVELSWKGSPPPL